MLSKTDKTYLAKTFVTKKDLKKTLANHPTHDDLKKAVRDEFYAQKPEWTREITESIKSALGDKIDKMYVKLDTFIGEIKARREEDAVHTKDHVDINDRLDVLEKHAGIAAN